MELTASQLRGLIRDVVLQETIRQLGDGDYRIYSERTGKNLGTFSSREKAEEHLDRMKRFRSKRKKKS